MNPDTEQYTNPLYNSLHRLSIGVCLCGCGRSTTIAKRTDARRHAVKGQHMRYIQGHSGVQNNRCKAGHVFDRVRLVKGRPRGHICKACHRGEQARYRQKQSEAQG